MQAGAWGYVTYNRIEVELQEAIFSISNGCIWFEREVIRHVRKAAEAIPRLSEAKNILTYRQRAILTLLQLHLSNKEIGSRLGISERTVRFHLSNLFAKLDVHDRYSAIDRFRFSDANVHGHASQNSNSERCAVV